MPRVQKMLQLFEQLESSYQNVMTMREFADFVHCFPGLLSIHGENGYGIAFSNAFCTALQYDEAFLLGDGWQKVMHPDDIEQTTELIPDFKSGAISTYKNRWRRADGTYLSLRWSMAPWEAAGQHKHFTICVAHVEGVENA